jgi:hypothetical protein
MKNHIIVLISVVVGFGANACEEEKTIDRPNVIIVMTDDQGYGELSCHGNPVLKTPNLDQLTRQRLNGTRKSGYWLLDVAEAGEYDFELRRWPREIDTPLMDESATGGAALPISTPSKPHII